MEKVISSQKGSLSNTNGLPCDLFYWVMTYDIARLYPQGSSSEGKERCGVRVFSEDHSDSSVVFKSTV